LKLETLRQIKVTVEKTVKGLDYKNALEITKADLKKNRSNICHFITKF
jgi:hypothetical protein